MTPRPAADGVLAAITTTVVRCCDPDLVVLFGSWAKGSADVHSDVDLLVVGPFRQARVLRDRELRDALRCFPLRFDLHLLTAAELRSGTAQRFGYLDTIRRASRVLHHRPGGVDPVELGFAPADAIVEADGSVDVVSGVDLPEGALIAGDARRIVRSSKVLKVEVLRVEQSIAGKASS